MKVIIVGGVAGGASRAARLRRLDEKAEIIMVERGPYVSYANCGLPYHVGGVIEKESSLLLATAQTFHGQFNIEVRTNTEAVEISATEKTVSLRNVTTSEITHETYDKLVLAPGAVAVRPPLPGIDLPGIFHVRTVPDAKSINEWIEKGNPFLDGIYRYSGTDDSDNRIENPFEYHLAWRCASDIFLIHSVLCFQRTDSGFGQGESSRTLFAKSD
jgi:NADPH-dependent 2,4-dienoyl-CoA reductase/sulfur reductase-like enzyme